jgi:YVTN family beta-propeller protein
MNLWVSTRAAIAAFGVAGALSGAQSLAQNAYITNGSFSNNNVSVINTVTNAVIATIPVGANPYSVAVTADGSKAYVTNTGSQTVSVIDTATNTVTATIPAGTFPLGVAVTPDGSKVYVTNPSGVQSVSVIAAATNTVIATIPVGGPDGVAVSPDGSKVYVADSFGSVAVIDTATDTVTDDPGRRQSLRRGGDPGRKQGLCYE